MTGSSRSGVMLWNALSRRMPALLITMSTRPKASIAVSTIAWPPSGVATLSVLATATPPRSSICLAAVWAGPSSPPSPDTDPPRSLITTCAPRDARSLAGSKPKPPPAPVMIATFPSKPRSAIRGRVVTGARPPEIPRTTLRRTPRGEDRHGWPGVPGGAGRAGRGLVDGGDAVPGGDRRRRRGDGVEGRAHRRGDGHPLAALAGGPDLRRRAARGRG